jgi:(S)-ureidoglycine aminohydrolase
MSLPYGQTRTRVAARHALIAPDGHVKSNVPGITGAASIVLINPAMGAGFAQLLVTFESGGRAALPGSDVETAGYFETGGGTLTVGRLRKKVDAGAFFVPAGEAWSLAAPKRGTRLTLFQKKFVPLAGENRRRRSSAIPPTSGARHFSVIRRPGFRCCCPTCRHLTWR